MKPAEKFWSEALVAIAQSDFGIGCLPAVSYGPWTLSLTGPFSCWTPWRSSESSRSMRALLIGVENALSSVSFTSPELLPPQAVSAAALSARTHNNSVRKVVRIRREPSRTPLESAQDGSTHNPLHRQGRGRQDERHRGHWSALRRAGYAHDHAVHRSRPLPLGLARGRARQRADGVRRAAVGTGGPGAGRDGAPLGERPGMAGRAARGARGRPDLGRGGDGAPRQGRALLAAADQAPPRGSPLRRDHRRLRPDRRDPPAAVVPRRLHLVAREGLPLGAAADGGSAAVRADAARHPAAERSRDGRRAATGAQPRRDEFDPARSRHHVDPARDESR